MKIIYIPTLNLSVDFYRCEQPAEALIAQGKHGVHIEYMGCDPRAPISWEYVLHSTTGEHSDKIQQSLIAAFKCFDVIIVQRFKFAATLRLFKVLREANPNVKVFVDIDDSITSVSQSSIIDLPQEYFQLTKDQLALSDGVIVTNYFLGHEVYPYNQNIYIMPNFIRKDNFTYKKDSLEQKDRIRLGYVGASGHDHDLESVWDELVDFIDRNDKYELSIHLGGYKPSFLKESDRIKYKNLSVHISEYPQKLYRADIDIFIAPLRDLHFNRCKSELKILEALFMSKPIVVSNVRTFNNDRTRHMVGKGLYLAKRGEWEKTILGIENKKHKKLRYLLNKNHSPRKIIDGLTNWLEDQIEIRDDKPICSYTKYSFII